MSAKKRENATEVQIFIHLICLQFLTKQKTKEKEKHMFFFSFGIKLC